MFPFGRESPNFKGNTGANLEGSEKLKSHNLQLSFPTESHKSEEKSHQKKTKRKNNKKIRRSESKNRSK